MSQPVFKRETLRRAVHRCERCGANADSLRRSLQVHHRDRNRMNNAPSNLEALCQHCHRQEHRDAVNRFLAAHPGLSFAEAVSEAYGRNESIKRAAFEAQVTPSAFYGWMCEVGLRSRHPYPMGFEQITPAPGLTGAVEAEHVRLYGEARPYYEIAAKLHADTPSFSRVASLIFHIYRVPVSSKTVSLWVKRATEKAQVTA